ncbi:MAG: hypothetical protein U0163_04540 [Gemmatimonadaceae bacterium]
MGRLLSAARECTPPRRRSKDLNATLLPACFSGRWRFGGRYVEILTGRSTLENLTREAKRWLKALRAADDEAWARFRRAVPNAPGRPVLRDVQFALAREYGLSGWSALKSRLLEQSAATTHTLDAFEEKAEALLAAYRTGTAEAMARHWALTWHRRSWSAMRTYVQLDLGRHQGAENQDDDITLDDARYLVAREHAFPSWAELVAYVTSTSDTTPLAARPVTAFQLQPDGERVSRFADRRWDEVFEFLRTHEATGLHAEGQMTDEILARVSSLALTALDLSGCKAVTDDGVRHLARMPQLQQLDLSGTAITDAGLRALNGLPGLRRLNLSWTRTTDSGAAHLAQCRQLESVDLTWTATGDGALRALAGATGLRRLMTGSQVTDAGLTILHEYPRFASWHGGSSAMALLRLDHGPTHVALHGAISDRGLQSLHGLDGLYSLHLTDDALTVTAGGLASLRSLPHLEMLAVDATDDSMPVIAALPALRFLFCQDTTAGDEGFESLSRSPTLEFIWGRRCHNLGDRGFRALARMAALRSLAVSFKNVSDRALEVLPTFPALRELMPMDVPDAGYRHIARCQSLDALILMYCRDTGDAATEHVTALPGLRRYFVSYNTITDRTPQLLSGMDSLEEIEFSSCAGLTEAGIVALARLPCLRVLRVDSVPRVTAAVRHAFQDHVRVVVE